MNAEEVAVYVFSYNRPDFLRNCVGSVFACFPGASVTVVDDDSTDEAVSAYIASLGDQVRILAPARTSVEHKTGGLYANMNAAVADACARGFSFALFIQDDMQFVRKVVPEDFGNWARYFSVNDKAVQLDLCFRKRQFLKEDVLHGHLDTGSVAYFRDEQHPGVIGITDCGIYHLDRLASLFGEFEIGEVRNQKKARKLGIKVGSYVYPAIMWLPFPESHRRKSKSWYLRIIEWFGRVGFYPYSLMDERKVEALLSRDVSKMPVGEEWLCCPKVPDAPRWSYTGGLDNVRARGGLYTVVAMLLGGVERVWRQ